MFGFGFLEIIVIAIIGLIVVGPEQLPHFVKKISTAIIKLQRMWNQLRNEVSTEFHNIIDEKEQKELKNQISQIKNISFKKQFEKEQKELKTIKKTINKLQNNSN